MLQSLRISDYEMTKQEPTPAAATSYAPVVVSGDGLSVVLIGPDENRRYSVASALTGAPCRVSNQLSSYPQLDQLPRLLKQNFDIAILDLDSDPETALELVENLCAISQLTVMVYSMRLDSELMLSCMRAGAREFLTFPITPTAINEAMIRASARRTAIRPGTKENGRLCVFCGAKGGAGVTTMASNFAVAAAKETGEKVLLIDLDLPLGDSALVLGLNAQYSTVDALQNSGRLDSNLLSRLIVQHDSGLHVLAAPGNFVNFELNQDAVNKLIQVVRQEYDTVVIDSGSRFQLKGSAIFGQDAVVYLVSHVGISELRNSNRIISELFPANLPRVEIILNRYSSSALGVDDEHITRALTRPAAWRIPEDRATLREMQNTATPLVQGDSGVAKVIKQMARTACGLNNEPEKKKALFGLF